MSRFIMLKIIFFFIFFYYNKSVNIILWRLIFVKEISILFTRYTDNLSKLVYWVSGRKYTHVSISLDNNNEYFYSFNKKRFRKEFPSKHKTRAKEAVCYIIKVTEEAYEKLKKIIEDFIERKEQLKYNLFGLILCIFGIPLFLETRFFCSSFVAFALEAAGILILTKNAAKYFPNALQKEIDSQVFLIHRIENPDFLRRNS